jgi:hypothetical protein
MEASGRDPPPTWWRLTPCENFRISGLTQRTALRYLGGLMTTTDDTTTVLDHPFTRAGMGRAPFKFVGACSIPSNWLAGENPSAYNAALSALPRHLKGGLGTCCHCGMAIMNVFIVRNADGDEYGVGCDCIEKVGDTVVTTAMRMAKNKMEREKRAAKRDARHQRAAAAAKAEREAYAASPEGIAAAAAKAAEEKAEAERRAAIQAETMPLGERLKDGRGGFCDSVAFDLIGGQRLRGRAAEIAADILAKQCGRRNSKAYAEELDRVWPLLTGEA